MIRDPLLVDSYQDVPPADAFTNSRPAS